MRTEDGSIIQKCLNGEPEAFGFLVDKYKESIYAFVYTKLRNFHDAEDVTQEVFIRAYKKLNTLKRYDSFLTWLYSIASNLCKNMIRSHSRRLDNEPIGDKESSDLDSFSVNSYRNDAVQESMYTFLDEALDSLPDTYQQVLTLHFLGNMSCMEIAEFTGTSPNAIKQRLYRARAKLREEVLTMLSTTFEQQKLRAGFTFKIVETAKQIRVKPIPIAKGLPLGISLATGFLAMVLSFNPYSIHILNKAFPSSSFPGKTQVIKVGEMPFDALNALKVTLASGYQSGNGSGGESKRSNSQSTFALAPKDQEYIFVKSWPTEILGVREPTSIAIDNKDNFYIAAGIIYKFDSNGNPVIKWGSEGSGDGQFSRPFGITVDRSENIYVADWGNNRIQKFDSNGNFLLKWGTEGSGDGQFNRLCNIAVGNSGNVYVSDTQNNRIQKFDSNGNFIAKWGSKGSGDGQFNFPTGIAVDNSDNIYVSDENNNRIQKFDSVGNFLASFVGFTQPRGIIIDGLGNIYVTEENNHRIQKIDSNGNFILKWGSQGSDDGQFNTPLGLVIDSSGKIHVADTENHRIQTFDSNGNFLKKWAYDATLDGQFRFPRGIGVDSSGNVFVLDTGNSRIQKFDSDSKFLMKWGGAGTADGQFSWSNGLGVDSSGNVYLADSWNNRIQQFDSKGNFVRKWGNWGQGNGQFSVPTGVVVDNSGNIYVLDADNGRIQKFDSKGNFSASWGSQGSGDGQFIFPEGIAIDNSKSLYVADSNNFRIQKFDLKGNFITKWGTKGTGDGQFGYPGSIAVDRSGNVYVLDDKNSNIQEFDSDGNFLTKWGSPGSGDSQFNSPHGIVADSSGYIYVADSGNNRIQKFKSSNLAVDQLNKLHGTWGRIKGTELYQNFPNPFNPETWIPFSLSKAENVKIKIYNSSGKLVRTLDLGIKEPGSYVNRENAAYWDGRNENGEIVASDAYFTVMEAGEFKSIRKMVMVK